MSQNDVDVATVRLPGHVPLGRPLPPDEHACSVSLPTWDDVVGYEEGDPEVTGRMGVGYPRFVYHPYVKRLAEEVVARHGDGESNCLLTPGRGSAMRARDFLVRALGREDAATRRRDNATTYGDDDDASSSESDGRARVVALATPVANVHAVLFPVDDAEAAAEAKRYWQHCGEVVSSRRALVALRELGADMTTVPRVTEDFVDEVDADVEGRRVCGATRRTHLCLHPSDPTTTTTTTAMLADPALAVRERVGSVVAQDASTVFLCPSGMAAVYHALRAARRRRDGRVVVFGFPYLDTLKLCGRPELVPHGVEFLGGGDVDDLRRLRDLLETSDGPPVSAVVTEFPSNPLLRCPDLFALRALADEHDVALIVDDTLSNFANVDLLDVADVVCTSLTKLFNGRGDSMAGSVVCSDRTPTGRWFRNDLELNHRGRGEEDTAFGADLAAVHANSVDFVERSRRINVTTGRLVEWLRRERTPNDVDAVHYPDRGADGALYRRVLRKLPGAGLGGTFSLELADDVCRRTFYDALPLSKGPSLGTNFTLLCPYTLLAHYHELDFARAHGVRPDLVRVAVGLEPFETLRDALAEALARGRRATQKREYRSDGASSLAATATRLASGGGGWRARALGRWVGHGIGRASRRAGSVLP